MRCQIEDSVAAVCLDDSLVEIHKAVDCVAGTLVAQSQVQRQCLADLPGVLEEIVLVPPLVVDQRLAAWKSRIEVRRLRDVVDKVLEGRVAQQTARRRDEEALHVDLADIDAELHRVVAVDPGHRILELVGIVEPELGRIDGESDGGPARPGVETGEAELRDLDRRNRLGRWVRGIGRRAQPLPRCPSFVQNARAEVARQKERERLLP